MEDKEWKELGVKPKLGREWQLLMDGLWIVSQKQYGTRAKNVENTIRIANWKIYANLINNDYLVVVVKYKDDERLEIRHTNENLTSILFCVFEVIKHTYKNPLK